MCVCVVQDMLESHHQCRRREGFVGAGRWRSKVKHPELRPVMKHETCTSLSPAPVHVCVCVLLHSQELST